METPDPYSEEQLGEFVALLRELKLDDYEAPVYHIINGLAQPLAGLIDGTAVRYKSREKFSLELDKSATENVRKEFSALKKSIERHPRDRLKIFHKCAELSAPATSILKLAAVAVGVDFEETIRGMRESKRAWDQFLDCLGRAPKYLNDPRGPSEDTALLDFATRLTDAYVEATGRKIGRGSQFKKPEYCAPLERFLLAAIKPARQHTTVNSVRGLIRKIIRKP